MRFFQIAVFVSAVVISTSPVAAQTTMGVGAGLNWSTLGNVDFGSFEAAYESQQGWHAGVFVEAGLGIVGIRPGLYYVNAGALLDHGFEIPAEVEETLTDFDYTYVSLPVDVVVGLPLALLRPYVFAGPEFKFNLVSDDEGVIAEQLESTVVAGNVGLGVAVALSSLTLYPEVRFAFDISGILGDEITIAGEEFTADKHSANAFIARLGVGF